MDAVDYFARAVHPKAKRDGDPVPEPPGEEVVADLKTAILSSSKTRCTGREFSDQVSRRGHAPPPNNGGL
jgi:hypothetical protein